MRLIGILGIVAIVIGNSGCTENNKHCKAGDSQTVEFFLTDAYKTDSQVESGIRTYTWEIATSLLSTNGIGQTIIRAYLDGAEQTIPLLLEWQRVVEGSESAFLEVTPTDTSLASVYSFEVIDQSDFSNTFSECEISYAVRMFVRFQTTGQEAFDDAYLESTIVGNSSIKLTYFLEED